MTETRPVRPGEEIDEGRLAEYLRSETGLAGSEIRISQFPAGSSNLTYSVAAGDAEFVLRRPPFGNRVKSAHDMAREFAVLSKLSAVFDAAPKPLFFCPDESVIGSEFYLMERRQGLIIRGRAPEILSSDAALRDSVCASFIGTLAKLHSLDYEAAGLGDLGRPEGYARRQVEGWTKRYFNARTDDHRELEAAVGWLGERIPETGAAALVHNDYKFDNVMLDPADLTRVTAVLDWEMTTVGDPLMDLGTTLGYWMSREAGDELLSMPFNPRVLMENIPRERLVGMYAEATGRECGDLLYYYVFGTFKIAVIAQQIYYRFVRGFTGDRRFARFGAFVGALGRIAAGAIKKGRI